MEAVTSVPFSSDKDPQPSPQQSDLVDLEEDPNEEPAITVPSESATEGQTTQSGKHPSARSMSETRGDISVPSGAGMGSSKYNSIGNITTPVDTREANKENERLEKQSAPRFKASMTTLEDDRSVRSGSEGVPTKVRNADVRPSFPASLTSKNRSARKQNPSAEPLRPPAKNVSMINEQIKDSELQSFDVPDSDSEPKKPKTTRRATSKKLNDEAADREAEAGRQKPEQETRDRKTARESEFRAEKKDEINSHEPEFGVVEKAQNDESAQFINPDITEDQADLQNKGAAYRTAGRKRRVNEREGVETAKQKTSKRLIESSRRKYTAEANIEQQEDQTVGEAQESALTIKGVPVQSGNAPINEAVKPLTKTKSTKETTPKHRQASEDANVRSCTPIGRPEPSLKRRSMTPMFPTSSAMKPPVKSALRTGESVSRRSVSFNDEAITAPNALASVASKATGSKKTTDALKSSGGNNAGKAASGPSRSKSITSRSANASERRRSDSSNANATKSSRTSTTPSKETNSKARMQTKLNVTRDVKKRGREIDRPLSLKNLNPASKPKKEEIVISSDSEHSDSTYYSDSEDQVKNPMPSSSSRKTLVSAMKPSKAQENLSINAPAKMRGLTPQTRHMIKEATRPSTTPRPGQTLEDCTRAMSKSRSPAQYIAKFGSESSRSVSQNSCTASEGSIEPKKEEVSGSESDVESGESDVESGEEKQKSKESALKPTHKEGALPEGVGSDGSESDSSDEESESEEDDLAEQQLHRESRQSLDPSSQGRNEPAFPTRKSAAAQSHNRFPSLSNLKTRGQAMPNEPYSQLGTTEAANKDGAQNSSSSESDDESDDNDSSDGAEKASQPKRKSGGLSGLRSLIKRMLLHLMTMFRSTDFWL